MEAVKNDEDWPLSFPVLQKEVDQGEVSLEDDNLLWRDFPTLKGYAENKEGLIACRIYKTVKAKHLWNVIMTSTYDYAEPGFILIDKVNQDKTIIIGFVKTFEQPILVVSNHSLHMEAVYWVPLI